VAMTGEVSLTGRVLPIGGVKQKLLAAHRAGITTVLIPKRNEPDLDDVPAEVLEQLTVHLAANVRGPPVRPSCRRRHNARNATRRSTRRRQW
jgi:ATP-dependent Lon protease